MHAIYGLPALSTFRLDRYLSELRNINPSLQRLSARFVYFCWFAENSEFDLKTLGLVNGDLNPPTELSNLDELTCGSAIVIPRIGTVSPWSTKATDIARHCGVNNLIKIERGIYWVYAGVSQQSSNRFSPIIHDQMTQQVITSLVQADQLHAQAEPRPPQYIGLSTHGVEAIERANRELGLALAGDEIDYLLTRYRELKRDPSDIELMMFAQANSEHCRHKIFNADWIIDGDPQSNSLFGMIRNTYEHAPNQVLSAYKDNSAVTQGYAAKRFFAQPKSNTYDSVPEQAAILMKVETHNHPTGISPYPGASTGSGGEIRDEGATGRGAKPKAGLTGFSVSHLRIPGLSRPWESDRPFNPRLASAFAIMQEAPIGAASFNNEFGRPALCGYFRSHEDRLNEHELIGYDKPIMLAGGLGNIRPQHIEKQRIDVGTHIIVLGGPAMLIGLGGGAASSMSAGDSNADLDFASVQRDNPEMERRCQEVINACWSLGADNPIVSIHDVGAGGLSNAVPEILHDSSRGGQINLRAIPNADPAMSPLEIWCNEAQERYVLAIGEQDLAQFSAICLRERCPHADIGWATEKEQLVLFDEIHQQNVIDLPMDVIFGKPPKMLRDVQQLITKQSQVDLSDISVLEAVSRILKHPTVGDKRFLITIGDRNVGGLSVRDQMVGPWQVPVADCAVTSSSFGSDVGEAMAIGERTPLATHNAPASGRMAIGEMITNIAAARILRLQDIVVSANWMAAADYPGQDAKLYETVKAVGLELCPKLGIVIPVGKDSMSMKTSWHVGGRDITVASPVSLIVSGFAPVADVNKSLTPQLNTGLEDSVLLLFDLGQGKDRIGGSILTECFKLSSSTTPDLDDPELIVEFFSAIQLLNETGYIESYHDRSDGGLLITLLEMAFASRCGLDISLHGEHENTLTKLFSEELGAVVQINRQHLNAVHEFIAQFPLLHQHVREIATLNSDGKIRVHATNTCLLEMDLFSAIADWSETTIKMQELRDNPRCALEERSHILDRSDPGLNLQTTLQPQVNQRRLVPMITRPSIAILREQGVNGQVEMAAAFDRAGFRAVDVHMSDLNSGAVTLDDFHGLAACGGFSFGDVLGAGGGWAKSILHNTRLAEMLAAFFHRDETFALGVCNGCQMLAHLHPLIPGAENWPRFEKNTSEQFEARLVMVEVNESPSILLDGMQHSRIPIVVAHGEGRVADVGDDLRTCLSYIDNFGNKAERYPANPNGSALGCAGLTSNDGRVTIMMPHPERVFLTQQFSWLPEHWSAKDSPWMRLFDNAKRFVS